jgi:hypothetical protein
MDYSKKPENELIDLQLALIEVTRCLQSSISTCFEALQSTSRRVAGSFVAAFKRKYNNVKAVDEISFVINPGKWSDSWSERPENHHSKCSQLVASHRRSG